MAKLTSAERWSKIFPLIMRPYVKHISGDEFKQMFLTSTDYFKNLVEGNEAEPDISMYSEDAQELFELLIGWMNDADERHKEKSKIYSENGKKGGRGNKKSNILTDESNCFSVESYSFSDESNSLQENRAEAEAEKEIEAEAEPEPIPLADASALKDYWRKYFPGDVILSDAVIRKYPTVSERDFKRAIYELSTRTNIHSPIAFLQALLKDIRDNGTVFPITPEEPDPSVKWFGR